jgi:hypothetical protein
VVTGVYVTGGGLTLVEARAPAWAVPTAGWFVSIDRLVSSLTGWLYIGFEATLDRTHNHPVHLGIS